MNADPFVRTIYPNSSLNMGHQAVRELRLPPNVLLVDATGCGIKFSCDVPLGSVKFRRLCSQVAQENNG